MSSEETYARARLRPRFGWSGIYRNLDRPIGEDLLVVRDRRTQVHRKVLTVITTIALTLSLALPAAAIESESGYKNCGLHIAALRAQFWGGLAHTPPGGSTTYWTYYGSGWGVVTRNGSYAGNWVASADDLNFTGTYPFCQPYG